MNWNRAKTILIILFMFADLFLLVTLMRAGYKSNSVMPEIISATEKVLANSGIKIDSDIIPSLTRPPIYAEADNVIGDYGMFAKKLLGDGCEKISDTSYSGVLGEVSFSGDGFSFKSAASSSGGDEKSARTAVENFLKNNGFDISSAVISTEKTDNGYKFTITNKVDSLPLFNAKVTAETAGNEVAAVSGIWFNTASTRGAENEIKTAASILIDFIPMATAPTEITSVSLGYTVSDSEVYHKAAVLILVWEITEASGAKHYLDARSPEA